MPIHRRVIKAAVPGPVFRFCNTFRHGRDWPASLRFLGNPRLGMGLADRLKFLTRLYLISLGLDSPHTQREMITYLQDLLVLPRNLPGVVVEAGCYRGSSAAKASLAADLVDRELVIFDSFQGLPTIEKPRDKKVFGRRRIFDFGGYKASISEVKANIARYGKLNRCRFVPGWFAETMPSFREPVAAAFLDVDVPASARTCVKYLYPLIQPGGFLYSHDGRIPAIVDMLDDNEFWRCEIGCGKPAIMGLRRKRLIKIVKT